MRFVLQVMCLLLALATEAWATPEDEPAQPPQSFFQSAMQRAREVGTSLAVHAVEMIGVNYRWGGASPQSGFDCSGFVTHVFRQAAGVALPHSAHRLSQVGDRISKHELQPGDLVFYNTLKRAFSHVGIYLGNNKFIHAPATGKQVQIADMDHPYWRARFEGARRIASASAELEPEFQELRTVLR